MKKFIILLSVLAIALSFSACRKETKTTVTDAEAANSVNNTNTVSQDDNKVSEAAPSTDVEKNDTSFVGKTEAFDVTAKPQKTSEPVSETKKDDVTKPYRSVVYKGKAVWDETADGLKVKMNAKVIDFDKNKQFMLVEGTPEEYTDIVNKYYIYIDMTEWDIAPGDNIVVWYDGVVDEVSPGAIHADGIYEVAVNSVNY